MIATALVAAALALAPPAPLVVEKGDARATITASRWSPDDPGELKVEVEVAERTREWSYAATWLDPEATGVAPAEILSAGGRDYLFVHTYSGGARCCWALLVFDLARREALGSLLPSESPIALQVGQGKCAVRATATPTGGTPSAPAREAAYCFDGRRFTKKRRHAPRRRPARSATSAAAG